MKKILILAMAFLLFFGCSTEKPVQTEEAKPLKKVEKPDPLPYLDDGPTLREAADAQGMNIGVALHAGNLNREFFAENVKNHFNYITAEDELKWSGIHPSEDTYVYSPVDMILEFAEQNNMKVRGHTLIWHNQLGYWVKRDEALWTPETLAQTMKDHIDNVAGHYRGRIYAWDVVNEAFDAGNYRKSVFFNVIGKDYIKMAFEMAHEADPDALLYYNDYGIETVGAKSTAVYNMAKELLAAGVPIHGIGFQSHLILEQPFNIDSFRKNIQRFVDLGLKVDLTELDIRIRRPATVESFQKQAEIYKQIMEVMLSFPTCDTVVFWGLSDKNSWIPSSFSGYGEPLLFDNDYQPKPAFFAVREVLNGGPVDLGEIGGGEEKARRTIPSFVAKKAGTVPVIDGKINGDEWEKGIKYPLGFNQLNTQDERPPMDINDLSGEWTVLYDGKTLYGLVKRTDEKTVTSVGQDWENDTVEVFFDLNGVFTQLRTLIGKGFQPNSYPGNKKAVWSSDGSVLEFSVDMPDNNLEALVCGWNIALADNDGGSVRQHQLYPVTGQNDSYQGVNLATLTFEGNSPRPPEGPRVVVPFWAKKADGIKVDGSYSDAEWKNAVKYPFLYNQLGTMDVRKTYDNNDIYGEWAIAYSGNKMYGYVKRQDDVTKLDAPDVWENDCVEVFVEIDKAFTQMRTLVGQDWGEDSYKGKKKAVWSADGTVLEFEIELPRNGSGMGIIGFNIALADNDGGAKREAQLYPIYGFNDSWQGVNLAELEFVK
ncbi:MAG: endo-1,4-beta-xylanase [Spirochaetales bacterium]|nr:endo-1,4-beta-xylanase [Spirochaetales bacterium]